MISVEEALSIVLSGAKALGSESVSVAQCANRIAAADIVAQITQPPFAASAMDGYAVRAADAKKDARLTVIGEAPAGAPFDGKLGAGEAVRIFTGAPAPAGADHIVIQEDVARDGDAILINEPQNPPRHIRPAGVDFKMGDVLAAAATSLNHIHGALFAAGNIASVPVHRRPKVALFSNGDELTEPGGEIAPGQIVNSNHYALTALINHWGGDAAYLGCAADSEDAIAAKFREGRDADIIVPVGGASVGDYDFVKTAFASLGGETQFEKVAVRPGKPTWFGALGPARVLGLPGNPASAIVTATLFLRPLVVALGGGDARSVYGYAPLESALPPNGGRESYLRARLLRGADGEKLSPAGNQDSSLLRPFAEANALVQRLPHATAAFEGDVVRYLLLR